MTNRDRLLTIVSFPKYEATSYKRKAENVIKLESAWKFYAATTRRPAESYGYTQPKANGEKLRKSKSTHRN
jgi:hypothetical protein